jgi:uncharacterized protein YecA (UPF0149 family)
MSATAVVHARIEDLAARLLDLVPAYMAAPGAEEQALRWAAREVETWPVLKAIGMAAAIEKGTPVATQTYRRPARNAPCPCGSARKFKHCHGSPKVGDRE